MTAPSNLFDPKTYEDARQPFLKARTLPAACYTEEAFLAREVDQIFLKSWLYVCREDEVAKAGDYRTCQTAGGPVIILRDREDVLRAFANSCRHRGARLLEGEGNCKRAIACPYHGWVYQLDGQLIGAPFMDRTMDFDKASWGLESLRLESWQGFIFVNYDQASEPLLTYFGDLPDQLGGYRFNEMVCVKRWTYELPCNWKLLIENSVEDYHTAIVHSGSIGDQITDTLKTKGNWDSLYLPAEEMVATLPGETSSIPPILNLPERLAKGVFFTVLYPNTQFACMQDCMWWFTATPLGARRCRTDFGFCFPRAVAERPDFEQAAAKHFHRWRVSIKEDNDTGALQQVGLESALRKPGPYSYREEIVHRIANWVLDRVLDGGLVKGRMD